MPDIPDDADNDSIISGTWSPYLLAQRVLIRKKRLGYGFAQNDHSLRSGTITISEKPARAQWYADGPEIIRTNYTDWNGRSVIIIADLWPAGNTKPAGNHIF